MKTSTLGLLFVILAGTSSHANATLSITNVSCKSSTCAEVDSITADADEGVTSDDIEYLEIYSTVLSQGGNGDNAISYISCHVNGRSEGSCEGKEGSRASGSYSWGGNGRIFISINDQPTATQNGTRYTYIGVIGKGLAIETTWEGGYDQQEVVIPGSKPSAPDQPDGSAVTPVTVTPQPGKIIAESDFKKYDVTLVPPSSDWTSSFAGYIAAYDGRFIFFIDSTNNWNYYNGDAPLPFGRFTCSNYDCAKDPGKLTVVPGGPSDPKWLCDTPAMTLYAGFGVSREWDTNTFEDMLKNSSYTVIGEIPAARKCNVIEHGYFSAIDDDEANSQKTTKQSQPKQRKSNAK